MADNSKIEWTGSTWNPIRNRETGKLGHFCIHESPGCKNCYAERLQVRFQNPVRFAAQDQDKVEVFLDEDVLTQPLRWKKPRTIFPCSMTDLFGPFVTDAMLDRIFAVMALTPQHTYQVLTKRSARMREYCAALVSGERSIWAAAREEGLDAARVAAVMADSQWGSSDAYERQPLPNVWLGVSAENQHWLMQRACDLVETPAAIRWLSCEPLLGQLDVEPFVLPPRQWSNSWANNYPFHYPKNRIEWIVAGGESGPGARGSTDEVEAWMRSLRDQCAGAGVAFFGKQNFKKGALPNDLMVREFPGGNTDRVPA